MKFILLSGIAYKEVEPAYTSQVCPNCYNLDSDNRNGKTFNCTDSRIDFILAISSRLGSYSNCMHPTLALSQGGCYPALVCSYKGDADQVASNNIKARAFNQEIKEIAKDYKYSTDKRHQKLREYYQQKHETWLQKNPEFQKTKQLKLTI